MGSFNINQPSFSIGQPQVIEDFMEDAQPLKRVEVEVERQDLEKAQEPKRTGCRSTRSNGVGEDDFHPKAGPRRRNV